MRSSRDEVPQLGCEGECECECEWAWAGELNPVGMGTAGSAVRAAYGLGPAGARVGKSTEVDEAKRGGSGVDVVLRACAKAGRGGEGAGSRGRPARAAGLWSAAASFLACLRSMWLSNASR